MPGAARVPGFARGGGFRASCQAGNRGVEPRVAVLETAVNGQRGVGASAGPLELADRGVQHVDLPDHPTTLQLGGLKNHVVK